jgi:hypothetical protein
MAPLDPTTSDSEKGTCAQHDFSSYSAPPSGLWVRICSWCNAIDGQDLLNQHNQLMTTKLAQAEIKGAIAENQYYIAKVRKEIKALPEWRDLLPGWIKIYEDRITELEAQLKAAEGETQ